MFIYSLASITFGILSFITPSSENTCPVQLPSQNTDPMALSSVIGISIALIVYIADTPFLITAVAALIAHVTAQKRTVVLLKF
ncbi:hypothetical protein JOM56_014437 [Amanita muscaria]